MDVRLVPADKRWFRHCTDEDEGGLLEVEYENGRCTNELDGMGVVAGIGVEMAPESLRFPADAVEKRGQRSFS